MKKLLFLTALAFATVASADVKIGTVDMMALVRNHPNYESNKKLLTDTERDYQKRMDTLRAELEGIQNEGKKLADEYRNPMLAQAAKAKIEKDIAGVQTRFMNAQQKMRTEAMRNQQELAELEARLLKAQAEDIRTRVAKFADKNGYDFVFDASAAIYSKKASDVTDAVLKEMGVDPKVAKEKAANESK